MKKGINKKALILLLFILTILVINLVMVSAADPVATEEWASKYIQEPVKNFFKTYIIPNYNDLLGGDAPYSVWAIISVFGFLVFCAIIFEIIITVSPLSSLINILIGIFIVLIFILFGWIRHMAGGLMVWIVALTGVSGIFGMIMLGIIFLLGGIALFTGWTWGYKWINKIKYNKALMKAEDRAMKKAKDVNALTELASDVEAYK